MPQLIEQKGLPRSRHRRFKRWSADERAAYLDDFHRSGLSAVKFCRKTGLPQATLAYWLREERLTGKGRKCQRSESRPAFARVAVVPSSRADVAVRRDADVQLRVLVRGPDGREAALEGVDSQTAIGIVALVLGTGLGAAR